MVVFSEKSPKSDIASGRDPAAWHVTFARYRRRGAMQQLARVCQTKRLRHQRPHRAYRVPKSGTPPGVT